VDNSLTIETDWESSASGRPEDAATFAALGIKFGNLWLTEAEDSFVNRVRQKVYLSAYPLAEWFAWNWWRLRWEPRRPTHDWAMAHRMSNVGGGYVWPDITIFSDGERIVFNSVPTRSRPSEPTRYLCQAAAIVRAPIFEDALIGFVQSTLNQLDAKQLKDSNLAAIWQNVIEERTSSDVALRRKLEALLGYDVDEAAEDLIERLVQDTQKLGEAGVHELAASYNGKTEVASSSEIEAAAITFGFPCDPRDSVRLRPDIASQLPIGEAAWKRGVAAARALREQEGLGYGPISNKRLSQLAGVTESAIQNRHQRGPITFEYDTAQANGKIVLKSSYETGRRFGLARLLGDKIASSASGPFKLAAQRTFTYRQKLQRAFAGEFLCPFEELEKVLDCDFNDDAIQDAAQHFNVSDIAVRTLLVNNRVIDRDNLLVDDFDTPTSAAAA
jgi:hypothetical protein